MIGTSFNEFSRSAIIDSLMAFVSIVASSNLSTIREILVASSARTIMSQIPSVLFFSFKTE